MGSAAKDNLHILQQQIAVRLQDLQDEINCSFDQNQGQFALANNWFVKGKKKTPKRAEQQIFFLYERNVIFPCI